MIMHPYFELLSSWKSCARVGFAMSHPKILHNPFLIFVLFNYLVKEKNGLLFRIRRLCGVACYVFCICESTYGRVGNVFHIPLALLVSSPYSFCKGWIHIFLGFGFRFVKSTCYFLSSSGSRHWPSLFWFYHTYGVFMGCCAHHYNTCTNNVVIHDYAFYDLTN